jgi:hypothetical protein
MIMKIYNRVIQCGIVLLVLAGCQNKSKVDFSKALDMNISLQEKTFQNNSSNILTISLENNSKHLLVVPEAKLMLEFTSYSGSIKKTYNLELSGNSLDISPLPNERLGIKGNGEITRNVDLKNVLAGSSDLSSILPADDYAVNLVLKLNSGSSNPKSEKLIRSNYLYVQVEG